MQTKKLTAQEEDDLWNESQCLALDVQNAAIQRDITAFYEAVDALAVKRAILQRNCMKITLDILAATGKAK
jgi:hypothetical protein